MEVNEEYILLHKVSSLNTRICFALSVSVLNSLFSYASLQSPC